MANKIMKKLLLSLLNLSMIVPFSVTSDLSVASNWAIWIFSARSFSLNSLSLSKLKALFSSFSFASLRHSFSLLTSLTLSFNLNIFLNKINN
jgi:hypothetical protein